MKNFWLMIVVLFVLGGCASDYIMPLDTVSETGETTRSIATTTGDASMYKENVKYAAWRQYYISMQKAQEHTGIQIGYQEIKLSDGTVAHLPTLTVRQPLVLPPPPEVSEHPVWKTTNALLGTALRWGFGYLAVDAIVGGYNAANANGGYSNYVNSGGGDVDFVSKRSSVAIGDSNTTTTVSDINQGPDNQKNCESGDCDEPEDIEGSCGEGSFEQDGVWWITPGCSCSSRAAGNC